VLKREPFQIEVFTIIMLVGFQRIAGTTIIAEDGPVGEIEDLFFHLETWSVQYVVVNTGSWLSSRKVLLRPNLLSQPDWEQQQVSISLTRQQVRKSPGVETQPPASRQMEHQTAERYKVPFYWGPAGSALAGGGPSGFPLEARLPLEDRQPSDAASESENVLRSAHEMKNYTLEATDGTIGHLEDWIVDTQAWVIRYGVVDTKNWLPARKVLVHAPWIKSTSWSEATATVNLLREEVKGAPRFEPDAPIDRDYEERLFGYYGRESYWVYV